jgi:prepilin-type N-terminal cleavage/methylation domain-containing protein
MRSKRDGQAGFSLVELVTVLGIAGVVAAIAIPSTTRTLADLRMHNDARAIHNLLSLAKMRAAAKFTKERLYVDLGAETFGLQKWDKTAGTWVAEEGVETLSTTIDFGFGALTGPPPDTQAALGQAAACLANDNVTPIANTACVVFNSRGIPIDKDGNPDGNGGFYVTDHETGVYGITVSATPLVRLWWTPAVTTSWMHK